jgi:predicted DNA-binding mobile mystery protein A
MKEESTSLHAAELDRCLDGFRAAREVSRPRKGWIRAIREALGVSAGELGRILGVSRQLPLQFEKAEADDSITLKSLRKVANALGCDLVYALVPRAAPMHELVENRSSAQTRQRVKGAPRPVAREIQAAAQINEEKESDIPATVDDDVDPYFCD